MTDNTKQSEETYIRWSVNMNSSIEVGQIEPEPVLTIHPDGRVTTSPRLKPDEISALVLDQIKTAWLKDAQATKIRELQEYITQLENRLRSLWDKYDGDRKYYMNRIKMLEGHIECLESVGDSLFNGVSRIEAEQRWRKAKEAK
tara:strand:+ start:289 stop:720 length:432 start_codon:yes stop_codon:yes gene_type:complete